MADGEVEASALVLGLSGEDWDRWMIAALVVAALAAAAVVITTYFSLRAHKLEADVASRALTRFKVETEGRVADARAEGVRAGERAGAAQAAADTARAEAAKFSAEAAEANLKTERLRAQLAWRTLTPEQRRTLLQAASAAPGSVNIRYVDGDPEALALASEFAEIFRRAGWRMGIGAWKPANELLTGIHAPSGPSRLTEVLAAAGMHFPDMSPARSGLGFNVQYVPDAPTLMIGSKPRPAL
jgi:hypothetical protein